MEGKNVESTKDFLLLVKGNYNIYIESTLWASKRMQIIEKRKKCEICGEKENLILHHLNYEKLLIEEEADLQLLCEKCHREIHRKIREVDPFFALVTYTNDIVKKMFPEFYDVLIKERDERWELIIENAKGHDFCLYDIGKSIVDDLPSSDGITNKEIENLRRLLGGAYYNNNEKMIRVYERKIRKLQEKEMVKKEFGRTYL